MGSKGDRPVETAPENPEPVADATAPAIRRWIPGAEDLGDWVLFLLIFAFYLRTMARDITWGDSAEFALVAAMGGVSHPTGYPLYTLILLFVATWIPLPVPVSVALVSALAAAASFPLLRRVMGALGVSPWIARAFCLMLAFSREIWIQASTPEVYALHLLFTSAILRELVRHEVDLRRMATWVGLALTHHLQSLFLIPGLIYRVWRAGVRPTPLTPVLVCAPLLLYLLLPWEATRERPFAWGQPDDVGSLLAHVSGRQFSYRMFRSGDEGMGVEVTRRTGEFMTQFDPAGLLGIAILGFALLGFRELTARDPRSVALAASATLTFLFAASYSIPDKDPYFITVTVILALLASVGVDALDRGLRKKHKKAPVRPRTPLPSLCLVLSLVPMVTNFRRADHSDDQSLRDYLEDVAEVTAPSGSLVLVENIQAWMGAVYLAKVEGKFPSTAFLCTYLTPLPWAMPQFARLFPQVTIPEDLVATIQRHRSALALDDMRRALTVEEGLAYLEKELVGRTLTDTERPTYSSALQQDPKGFLNQMLSEWVQRRMVEANLPQRPCYLALHRYDTPPKGWNGMVVEDRGMVLGLHREPVTTEMPALTFPAATDYPVDRIALPDKRRLARRYASILNRFGILHIQRGAHRTAEICFLGAVSRDAGYAVAHTNLGVLYEKHLKRPDRAVYHYQKSVDLDPGGDQATAIRGWLAKQRPPGS